MKSVLVSACLLGVSCRYDGKSVPDENVLKLLPKYNLIPVCAEIFGGLPTPRIPCEIVDGRVLRSDMTDVTEQYVKGAEEVLRLAGIFGSDTAILKERSPSCGSGSIYDGSFTGTLTKGDGIAARLLKQNGITVIGESEVSKLL